MVVGNCWIDLPGNLSGFHVWLQPSETKIQMIKFIYPAEDLQGKWDKTLILIQQGLESRKILKILDQHYHKNPVNHTKDQQPTTHP
jgi:hypothetical protein